MQPLLSAGPMQTRAVRPICPHMHPPIHDAHVQALPTPAAPLKGFATCQRCKKDKPRADFSGSQLQKGAAERRCGECIAATGGPKFVRKEPLVHYPLLAGCSAEVTDVLCPREAECLSPFCGNAHRCSAPASSLCCGFNGAPKKLARRGVNPTTHKRITRCRAPMLEQLKSPEAIANHKARAKMSRDASSATDTRKAQKTQNKAARQGTDQEVLTPAEFEVHVLAGLHAVADFPAFRLLLSMPAAGLGGFDMEGLHGKKNTRGAGFHPMSAAVVDAGGQSLLNVAVNSAAKLGLRGIEHVSVLYPGDNLAEHTEVARLMASTIAGAAARLSDHDLAKFFDLAPKYDEFVAAYKKAVGPLKAIICYHGPEKEFHGSVGSDTEIIDVFPIVQRLMQPACVDPRYSHTACTGATGNAHEGRCMGV